MTSEKVTLGRPSNDGTEFIEQLPKTVASHVYNDEKGEWLTETIDDVTQQLIQVENAKADIEDISYLDEKKLDITIFESEKENFATLDSIASISDGTPLFAETVSGMTDVSRLYVNTTDGYIYTYNGTAWVSTGRLYQSTGIASKSVSPDKTTFVKVSSNLLNPSVVITDKTLRPSDGSVLDLVGYFVTDYIPVKSGLQYTISNARNIAVYNQSKVLITGQYVNNTTNAVYTVTATQDGFLRATFNNTYKPSAMIAQSSTLPPYEPYEPLKIPDLKIDESQIVRSEKVSNGLIKVQKLGSQYLIRSAFNSEKDIVIIMTRNSAANNLFNFTNTRVIDKDTSDALAWTTGTILHANADDVAPIRTYTTVGANHGYPSVFNIANNGKTIADVGSVWSDGNKQFTLLSVSAQTLLFGCDYTIVDGVAQSIYSAPVSALSHVSGATNTSSIPLSGVTSTQLYPSVKNVSVLFLLDDAEIIEDGVYFGDKFKVSESYDILEYKSIIDYARLNVGNSFASNLNNIDSLVKLSNTYIFDKQLVCKTYHSIYAYKRTKLSNCGFLQSIPIASVSGMSKKRVMPFVKAKGAFDFAQGIDLDSYATSLVFKPEDNLNAGHPPSYCIDWLVNASNQKVYGFALGYITDKSNSKNSDRMLMDSWDMRSTKKSYPIALQNITLVEGDFYDFAGFRAYLSGDQDIVINDAQGKYVYVANDTAKNLYDIPVPDSDGKEIEVIQSSNLNIKSSIVANDSVIAQTTASNSAGILKIN